MSNGIKGMVTSKEDPPTHLDNVPICEKELKRDLGQGLRKEGTQISEFKVSLVYRANSSQA